MFDFTFQNPYGFLCAFIPALFNLALVVYILFFLPRNSITNVFALTTFACALWQITDSFIRITATETAADFWDSVLSISWLFVGPLSLHFTLLYTQMMKSHLRFIFRCSMHPVSYFLRYTRGTITNTLFNTLPFGDGLIFIIKM